MTWRRVLRTSLVLFSSGCVQRTYDTVEVSSAPVVQEMTGLRSVTNLPDSFTVVTPANVRGDCPRRLQDVQLRTTLTLHHATVLAVRDSTGGYRAVGDYTVEPPGRYGETRGEGLRLDCLRLRALGIVPIR